MVDNEVIYLFTVFGTTLPNSPITILPISLFPNFMSKKTLFVTNKSDDSLTLNYLNKFLMIKFFIL